MFTGIIECVGHIKSITKNGSNLSFLIYSPISNELKVDQSISHDGVCLTVEKIFDQCHQVTAIKETLVKSNLATYEKGFMVNLERCLPMNGRIDGHIVQGHVDCTAICKSIQDLHGSYKYRFQFPQSFRSLVIEKGSIAVNGISLTIFDVSMNEFSVALIPYTYDHTNLQYLKVDEQVNIEFDLIGKYIQRNVSLSMQGSILGDL
ncbi:MAG: riboflavin synthase [Bacteroidetes bacterium]|nr:riboflavin synthase [Bacteroidota bacterium]